MKERLLYIDVLRGLAILIVIYSHVLLFCVGSNKYYNNSCNRLFHKSCAKQVDISFGCT